MIETSDEQKILLTNLRRVVKDKIEPIAGETDIKGTFNWDVVSLFWDLGLLQIMLPEAYGGWPHNPCHTLCLSIEEISKACASSALLLVIQAVGSFPLISAANQQQKEKYFPRISRGRELMAYLVSEPGAGSDVQAILCTARRSNGSYVLNGRKVFATNGSVAGLYSVLAKTGEKELSFFVV
ncbi:MAG: acyl-CoA dehydrogenase family protein, partial [Deltaproteobacteria bacterium]|nr:acyl-CoA dehydrogenase family protein [Deltaproteobacteria bacterium]MBW1911426.1 acyl-CoA dehydrogenase family protein [Deltaproteobacteria bacterium]